MPIVITCPNPLCRKKIGIPEQSIGKRMLCPLCKHEFAAADSADTRELEAPSQTETREAPAASQPSTPRHATGQPPATARTAGQKPAGSVQPKPVPPTKPARAAAKPGSVHSKPLPPTKAAGASRDDSHSRRMAQFRRKAEHASSTRRSVGIVSLVVLAIGVIVGTILLLPQFLSFAGSGGHVFVLLQKSVRHNEPEQLWDLMTPEDKNLAVAKKEEFTAFLQSISRQPGVRSSMAQRLLLDVLKSRQFNIPACKYVKSSQAGNEDFLVYQNMEGNNVSIRMSSTGKGWRIALAAHVLQEIEQIKTKAILAEKARAAAEKRKSAPPVVEEPFRVTCESLDAVGKLLVENLAAVPQVAVAVKPPALAFNGLDAFKVTALNAERANERIRAALAAGAAGKYVLLDRADSKCLVLGGNITTIERAHSGKRRPFTRYLFNLKEAGGKGTVWQRSYEVVRSAEPLEY